jgi:hypothetical protein
MYLKVDEVTRVTIRHTKKLIKTAMAAALLWCAFPGSGKGQDLYDLKTIQKIEIQFAQSNWDYMLDTAKRGSEGYLLAPSVTINGERFDSVGVKYKGNSSYNAQRAKNPFHIKLDYKIKNQGYHGYEDIKLSNGFQDPSMIREALAYHILKNYMDCSQSNFAQVYINGAYHGLYTNNEDINKEFLGSRYSASDGIFIKCNPEAAGVGGGPGGPGGGNSGKSNLRYISSDSSGYLTRYEMKSDYGWKDLVSLCNVVTNTPATLADVMDVDKAIWMLAFNNLTVNLDSYSGNFVQNYYLYKDRTGQYNPIIWDLNMCFASFTQTGTTSLSNNTQKQQLSTTLHSADADWPLIKAVLGNPMYRKMYFAHMRTINDEIFATGLYKTMAADMQSTIDAAVEADPNKLYTYAQFRNGMTQDVSGGMGGGVIAIGNLMDARSNYLKTTDDFKYTQPSISEVAPGSAAPVKGESVSIEARVSDASSVYLGYRYGPTNKFLRIPMYDDGAHNDGAAGDNLYAADILMNADQVQYYIYAENANAGKFSPERAEYVFHTLDAKVVVNANPGDIIINEFLASNDNGVTDDEGDREDWIELYNTTSQPISLSGIYLTDKFDNPTKWAFPDGASIAAHSYIIVWADEDSTGIDYHASFKLSAAGEALMLGYGNGVVLDSITFGAQVTDVSMSRCPDVSGSFISTATPTPGSANVCEASTGVEDFSRPVQILVYPNPAINYVNIVVPGAVGTQQLVVYTISGDIIFQTSMENSTAINTELWPAGTYFVTCGTFSGKIVKQ